MGLPFRTAAIAVLLIALVALPAGFGSSTNRRGAPLSSPVAPGRVAVAMGRAPGAPSGYLWTNLSNLTPSQPSLRADYGLAYDPVDHYTVLFGGLDGATSTWYGDTWIWANATWTDISTTAGSSPSNRYDPGMAWDSTDGYVVLFGGSPGSNIGSNDTYTFLHGTWTSLTTPVAPAQRYEPVLVDEPALGGVLLFGGSYGGGGTYYNDTWLFHAGVWKQLSPVGGFAPAPRRGASGVWDTADSEVMMFGGVDSSFSPFGETWTFANNTWTKLAPGTSPAARWLEGLAYDPSVGAVVLAGGSTSAGCYTDLADTWSFVAGNWTSWGTLTPSPPARCAGTMAYDPDGTGDLLLASAQGSSFGTWGLSAQLVGRLLGPEYVDVGESFAEAATVGGGTTPYTWGSLAGAPIVCTNVTSGRTQNSTCHATAVGSYNLTLSVSDSASRHQLFTSPLVVGPVLNVTLTVNRTLVDASTSIRFTSTSSGGAGSTRFAYAGLPPGCGGGNVATFTCTPTAAGQYNVTVTVSDAAGFSNRSSTSLTVVGALKVVADLPTSVNDLGVAVVLTVNVTGGSAPYSVAWAGLPLGCAGADTLRLPCDPSSTGAFTTTALVTDPSGGAATATFDWSVVPPPSVTLTPSATLAVEGVPLGFDATPANGTGPYVFAWSFGDGTAAGSGVAVSHTFEAPADYAVVVTLTDVFGVAASASVDVTIVAPLAAVANVSASAITATGSVTFVVATSGGWGPFSYAWTGLPTGCGRTTVALVNCTPTIAGSISATATVSDGLSETARSSVALTVHTAAVLSIFDAEAAACSLAFTFQAGVREGGTAPFVYGWTFGDGASAGGVNASHTFATAGTYPITLSATDASGVTRNTTISLPVPNAADNCASATPGGGGGSPGADVGTIELYAGLAIAGIAVLAVVGVALARRRPPPPADPDPPAE